MGWYNINQAVGLVAGHQIRSYFGPFFGSRACARLWLFHHFPACRLPSGPVAFPDYSGDLNTFFTIPYIGCQIFGPYFKGELLIGSASARLRLPLSLSHGGPYITGFHRVYLGQTGPFRTSRIYLQERRTFPRGRVRINVSGRIFQLHPVGQGELAKNPRRWGCEPGWSKQLACIFWFVQLSPSLSRHRVVGRQR